MEKETYHCSIYRYVFCPGTRTKLLHHNNVCGRKLSNYTLHMIILFISRNKRTNIKTALGYKHNYAKKYWTKWNMVRIIKLVCTYIIQYSYNHANTTITFSGNKTYLYILNDTVFVCQSWLSTAYFHRGGVNILSPAVFPCWALHSE